MQNVYRNIDTQITGVLVQAGQSFLAGWQITNLAATARFVKLYDKATAPTASDTPKITIAIPAGQSVNVYSGDASKVTGITFMSGIGIRASNLVSDADVTAPTANDVVTNLFIEA